MGRRAKNKQPAPEPLDAKVWQPGKRTGKRKADGDADGKAGRLVKKARKSDSGEKVEAKVKVNKQKSVVAGRTGKPKKNADDKSSADGWDDLEDGVDLNAHRKYVQVLISGFFNSDTCSQRSLFHDSDATSVGNDLVDEFNIENLTEYVCPSTASYWDIAHSVVPDSYADLFKNWTSDQTMIMSLHHFLPRPRNPNSETDLQKLSPQLPTILRMTTAAMRTKTSL